LGLEGDGSVLVMLRTPGSRGRGSTGVGVGGVGVGGSAAKLSQGAATVEERVMAALQ
jgi:hypothetical protein